RLNLSLEAIELDRDELAVLLRAAEVVESELGARDAVLQRPRDALVAAGLRGRQTLAKVGQPRRDLLLVHRLQEPIEGRLREQQPQEQPQKPIEPGRTNLLGASGLIVGRSADAGRDPAHLDTACVQLLESLPRIGRQTREHADERYRRWRRACGGVLRTRHAVDLRVDRRAKARNRDESGEIGEFAGRDEREEDAGQRRENRRRRAADQKQEVPAEKERLLEIV